MVEKPVEVIFPPLRQACPFPFFMWWPVGLVGLLPVCPTALTCSRGPNQCGCGSANANECGSSPALLAAAPSKGTCCFGYAVPLAETAVMPSIRMHGCSDRCRAQLVCVCPSRPPAGGRLP